MPFRPERDDEPTQMTPNSVDRALAACQAWLADQDTPEAEIAAHEAGIAESGDAAARCVRRILDDQAQDGSWGGDLCATAVALLLIRELRRAADLKEQAPGIGRGFDWIRSRRGQPGAWSDGCSSERHERGLCHHFLVGFYSPAPPEVVIPDFVLPGGAPVTGDTEARLVGSAMALHCLLSWGEEGKDARLHLDGLARLVIVWENRPPPGLTATALLAAIEALVDSPDRRHRRAVEAGLRLVAGRQRGDGSWVETDAFQALEVFTAAAEAQVTPQQTRRALWHGSRLLVSTQHGDGSWGREEGSRKALIGWRTLRRVQGLVA